MDAATSGSRGTLVLRFPVLCLLFITCPRRFSRRFAEVVTELSVREVRERYHEIYLEIPALCLRFLQETRGMFREQGAMAVVTLQEGRKP